MDQILAIPFGRKRQNVPLMCGIMAVTSLLVLSYINVLSSPVAPRQALSQPAMPAPLVIASAATN